VCPPLWPILLVPVEPLEIAHPRFVRMMRKVERRKLAAMSIQLCIWDTPNGRKISIALEEMCLPYTRISRLSEFGRLRRFGGGPVNIGYRHIARLQPADLHIPVLGQQSTPRLPLGAGKSWFKA
jgi:hypothetical protein